MTQLAANRPSLAYLRGKRDPEHLALWVEQFAGGDQKLAARYALAFARFLDGGAAKASYVGALSPHTKRAYGFAINEFFEWLAHVRGRVVAPPEVTRQDAEDYAQWLANRPFTLTEEKLKDGDQEVRLALYQVVQRIGPTDRRSIFAAAPERVKSLGLDRITFELGRMVLHALLRRDPSLEELRRDHPRAGIDQFEIEVPGPTGPRAVPLPDLFLYAVAPAIGVSRRTIALRLAALSSLWKALAEGENIPGGEPLLQHNVFSGVKHRVSRGLKQEIREGRSAQRIDPSLVPALVRAAHQATTLVQLRDRALFYFVLLTGVRIEEAIQLRSGEPPSAEARQWPGWLIDSEPPAVRLLRKGNKRMTLPYPSLAYRALRDFQLELGSRAAPRDAQSQDPYGSRYVHPRSPKWRYQELALLPDAPLFPPLNFWGANTSENYQAYKPNLPLSYGPPDYRRSLTAAGATACLKRLAERAGLSDSEIKQVHPHALRHFAATAMAKKGKDLREIQHMLGHDSITTTEGYLEEETDLELLSGQAQVLDYIADFGDLGLDQPPPPAAPRRVVETYAVSRPEPVAAPPAPSVEGQLASSAGQKGAPTPLQEAAAIQAAAPAYDVGEALVGPEARPGHDLPTIPEPTVPPVQVVPTSAGDAVIDQGRIIALEGEAPPPDVEADMLTTQITDERSPGSPDWVYEHFANGEAPDVIEFTKRRKRGADDQGLVTLDVEKGVDYVQDQNQRPLLSEYYDPWPPNYGIGRESLLVWFGKGNPGADGFITGTDPITNQPVKVAPLPVLAPEQVFEETTEPTMLDFVERLYTEWLNGDPKKGIAPSPTRTYGLARWWGFFSYTTAKLERWLKLKREETRRANVPEWVPFTTVAKLGKNVRAHKEEWLEKWFRDNAHTYTTSRRFFKSMVPRGRGESRSDQEFWQHFDTAAMEGIAYVAELPSWFAEDDPVHEIYESDPKEWDRFARWLANVTGQKLSRQRKKERKRAEKFAELSWEEKREEARELLMVYYKEIIQPIGMIKEYLRGMGPESPEEESIADQLGLVGMRKSELAEQMQIFQLAKDRHLETLATAGIPDPAEEEGVPRDLKARVQAIVDKHLPPEPDLDTPNVFRGSELFEAGFFQIDMKQKTIVHTEEYRQRFAERFDGRDSELVLRRAARAMWEWAKEHAGVIEGPTESQYGMLYSVMLMYISWIVPAPDAMEEQAIAAGAARGQPVEARRQWLDNHGAAMRALAYGGLGALMEAPEQLSLTDEDALTAIMAKFQMSPEQAKVALDLLDLQQAESAEIERWATDDAIVKEIAASIGPEGHMRVYKSPAESARERQELRKGTRVVATQSKHTGKLTPNRPPVVELIVGEECVEWYVVKVQGDLTPNRGAPVYVSPAALHRKRQLIANARQVLPSPFRAIAAMSLAEAETNQKRGWF